jgi:hypothetical protein
MCAICEDRAHFLCIKKLRPETGAAEKRTNTSTWDTLIPCIFIIRGGEYRGHDTGRPSKEKNRNRIHLLSVNFRIYRKRKKPAVSRLYGRGPVTVNAGRPDAIRAE